VKYSLGALRQRASESERNISASEWRRVTSIAIPALAVISIFQAHLHEANRDSWLFQYGAINLALIILGLILGVYWKVKLNFGPLLIFMITAPVWIGEEADSPWMSIGLISAATVIYFSGVANQYLAIAIVIATAIWQSFAAFQGYSSISDSRDISYFNSYFSFIWLLAIGIGSIYIRRRYGLVAESVHDIVAASLNRTIYSLRQMQNVNLKDSANLKLHGTVLNTLIYLKNLPHQKILPSDIRAILKSDLDSLRSEHAIEDKSSFDSQLDTLLEDRRISRMKVVVARIDGEINDEVTETGILEIIRESVLNLEKHTTLSVAEISVDATLETGVIVVLNASASQNFSEIDAQEIVTGSQKSLSLAKLLKSYQASHSGAYNPSNFHIQQEFFIPYIDFEVALKNAVAEARNTGLNDFGINYVRIGAYSGIATVLGLTFTGISTITLILLSAVNAGLIFSVEKSDSKVILWITAISSLFVMPVYFANSMSCEAILPLPWLWNILLTTAFLVTLRIPGYFIKWLPLILLGLESLYFPSILESGCQNILNGSTPAIPLIVILAIAVLELRKRELTADLSEVSASAADFQNINEIDSLNEKNLQDLLVELSNFAENENFDRPQAELNARYELLIQRIRTYLIASEKFDSQLVRTIYTWAIGRLNLGVQTRISLLGQFNEQLESRIDTEELIRGLNSVVENASAEITFLAGSDLDIQVISSALGLVHGKKLPSVAGVNFELSTP